jgi:general secretion pathway protein J
MTATGQLHDDSGFTLLELLVAMTLLGLLSIALFGALTFGVRSWERSETLTAQSNAVRQAQTLLSRTLGEAYPELLASDPTQQKIAFDGEAHSVRFLAPDPRMSGALDRIEIGVRQGSDALESRATLELAADARTTRTVILSGLSGFDISYYGKSAQDRDASWQDSWKDRASLPRLIRIRASFAQKRAAPWPDLLITPRISADVSCAVDPLTKDCRGP